MTDIIRFITTLNIQTKEKVNHTLTEPGRKCKDDVAKHT